MNTKEGMQRADDAIDSPPRWSRDLGIVLRRYGFWGIDIDAGYAISRLQIVNLAHETSLELSAACAIFAERAGDVELPGLEASPEQAGQLLFAARKRLFGKHDVSYHPLVDYVSFAGDSLSPIWQTSTGRTALGWWRFNNETVLLVGLNVTEELVRYTQGDPAQVSFAGNRNLWGVGHEQSAFLYEGHTVDGHALVPWADRRGGTLAQLLAHMADLPLFAPLPGGARGAVMLTGDDDQAWLEEYEEQLTLLGDFPITYLLLPHTNHTQETLAGLPANVEFGVHVDALESPQDYDTICMGQTQAVRRLIGDRPARTVRNHGHLNRDYWGHLSAWEAAGLTLDLNIRGLDGTCPTGSYLPFRVRRPDGSWSSHISLFSTFSTTMLFLQKWSEVKQIQCINSLADQIERSFTGIMVFNFHPQNVSSIPRVHEAVMQIGRRPGWLALGAESFLRWLEMIEGAQLEGRAGQLVLKSPRPVRDLAVRAPTSGPWSVLPEWEGEWTLESM